MNCSTIKASIQDFIDNNLDETTDHSVRSHLDSCPNCAREHKKYTSLIMLLHDSPVPTPSEAEWNRMHTSILENLSEPETDSTNRAQRRSPVHILKTPLFRIAATLLLSVVSIATVIIYMNLQSGALYPKVVAFSGTGLRVNAVDVPVGKDYSLAPGNAVETDKNSSIKIQVDKKSTLRIGNDSRCKVAAIATKRRIFELQKGDLDARISKRTKDEIFRIETPNAYCEVIGTRFNVTTQFDKYFKRHISTLLVEEGTVEFGSANHNMPVKAGYAVAIFGDSLGIPVSSNDTLIQLLRKQPGNGAFTVMSTPPGANVYIDGDLVGQTPLSNHAPFGIHMLTVSKTGFADWSDSIEITAHNRSATEISLKPGKDGNISPEDFLAMGNASIEKSVALMKSGKISQATAILTSLVNKQSTPPEILPTALYKLATCYKLNRNYDAAVQTLTRIINGSYSLRVEGKALFQRASIYHTSLHNHSKAISDFKLYTTRFPKGIWHEEALYSLSELYYYSNKFKDAAKSYTQFINTYGQTSHREKILFTLGTLYSNHLSDVKRGLNFYSRLLNEFPNSSYTEDALFWSASCLLRQGLTGKSSEMYKSYLQRFPKGKWYSEASQQLSQILSARVN